MQGSKSTINVRRSTNNSDSRPELSSAYASEHLEKGKVLGTSASHEQREFLKFGNSLGNASSKFDKTLGGSSFKKNSSKYATDMRVQVLPAKCFRPGPEFEHLEPTDVVFRIEHCRNCASHSYKSRHNEAQYRGLAQEFKQLLSNVCARYAVRCYVYVNGIEDHDPYSHTDPGALNTHHNTDYTAVMEGMPGKSGGNKCTWSMLDVLEKIHLETKTVRHGAFEIQVGMMNHADETLKHVLHSKLYSGVWPDAKQIEALLATMLDEHFGYYAALPEDGAVPTELYQDKVDDPDGIFIFDGTMLGDMDFQSILSEYTRRADEKKAEAEEAAEAEKVKQQEEADAEARAIADLDAAVAEATRLARKNLLMRSLDLDVSDEMVEKQKLAELRAGQPIVLAKLDRETEEKKTLQESMEQMVAEAKQELERRMAKQMQEALEKHEVEMKRKEEKINAEKEALAAQLSSMQVTAHDLEAALKREGEQKARAEREAKQAHEKELQEHDLAEESRRKTTIAQKDRAIALEDAENAHKLEKQEHVSMVNAIRRADKADLERDQAMKDARDARELEQKEHQLLLEAQREAREARETEQMEHRLLEESRQQVESAQAALRLKGGIVAPPAVHSAAVDVVTETMFTALSPVATRKQYNKSKKGSTKGTTAPAHAPAPAPVMAPVMAPVAKTAPPALALSSDGSKKMSLKLNEIFENSTKKPSRAATTPAPAPAPAPAPVTKPVEEAKHRDAKSRLAARLAEKHAHEQDEEVEEVEEEVPNASAAEETEASPAAAPAPASDSPPAHTASYKKAREADILGFAAELLADDSMNLSGGPSGGPSGGDAFDFIDNMHQDDENYTDDPDFE
jgi:hypothetical protein